MSNFITRTLSGAVYVALVVLSIFVHPIFFGVLFSIITILAVREYNHLVNSSSFHTIMSMIGGLMLFGTTWLWYNMGDLPLSSVAYLVLAYLLFSILVLVMGLFFEKRNPIQDWGNYFVSQSMVALPLAMMNIVYHHGQYLLLALFVTIWLNDSGAYCVGSLMAKRKGGNHKMFPRVSPAKSWEGLIGGVLVSLLAGYVYAKLGWFGTENAYVYALSFAFLVSVFGTLGDLMESLFKRTIGVKDSGKFMPGHGGVLDRFDSILLATPIIAAFVMMFL